jgi:MFS family permease
MARCTACVFTFASTAYKQLVGISKEGDLQKMVSTKGAAAPKLFTFSFMCATLVNFVLMVNYYMLMVSMTSYCIDTFSTPASLAGLCASIFIIGTLFARFASGVVMDRIGRKKSLLIGCVATIVFSMLYLVPMSLAPLMVLRFVHGFFYGVCSTAVATIVTSIVPASRKGEGVGYYMLSVTLGAALGPSVGIAIYQNFDFNILFACAVFAAVLATVSACPLKPAPRVRKDALDDTNAQDAQGDTPVRAEAALEKATEKVTPTATSSIDAEGASALPVEGRGGLRSLLNKFIEFSVLPISVVCGLLFFGYSSLLTFMTPFATELGLGAAASIYFIVYAITMFVTRPFTGKAFDTHGPRGVMVSAFVSFMIGMIVLATASNAVGLLGSAALLGYGVGTAQSSGLAIAVSKVDDSRLALANSTFYICLDVGVGLGPLILGAILPVTGYRVMFLLMAVVALCGCVGFLAAWRKQSRAAAKPAPAVSSALESDRAERTDGAIPEAEYMQEDCDF